MMNIGRATELGRKFIKSFEGYSETIYEDSGGYPTIGWGHRIIEPEVFNTQTTRECLEIFFKKDLEIAEFGVYRLIRVPLNDWQRDALISWTFNLGQARLKISTLRRKLNDKRYDSVSYEMKRWVYAGSRIIPGLVKRRAAEALLWSTGIYDLTDNE